MLCLEWSRLLVWKVAQILVPSLNTAWVRLGTTRASLSEGLPRSVLKLTQVCLCAFCHLIQQGLIPPWRRPDFSQQGGSSPCLLALDMKSSHTNNRGQGLMSSQVEGRPWKLLIEEHHDQNCTKLSELWKATKA